MSELFRMCDRNRDTFLNRGSIKPRLNLFIIEVSVNVKIIS